MAIFYQILGGVLILAGVPVFWLPIPLGAIMILTGLALILANSSSAQSGLQNWRKRHSKADCWLAKLERKTPGPFRRILEKTDGPCTHEYAQSKE